MDCAMMSHNQAIFHEREDNLGCNSRLHGTQRTALLLLGSRRHKLRIFSKIQKSYV
jgi:hypothetical protein